MHLVSWCVFVLAYDVLNNHDEVWVERKRGWVRASLLRSRAHVVSTPLTLNPQPSPQTLTLNPNPKVP